MVKIGKLTVNPYDVDEFIIFFKRDTCEFIIRYRSGVEQVAFEGTSEQCKSLLNSDICKRIAKQSLMRKPRKPRVMG